MGRNEMLLHLVVLLLLPCIHPLMVAAEETSKKSVAASGGSATPRQPPLSTTSTSSNSASSEVMLLEHANVNAQPVVTDANFKTLVRHCLKSHDRTACDGMAAWDVSRVTDCSLLFWEPTNDANNDWILLKGADTFNVDISGWNTSSCTTMRSMFNGAISFDQPIGKWNVHRVTDMSHMFQGARLFNRDVSRWKTDNVLDMSYMFRYASRFHNPDLSGWDVSRVTSMAYMFASASHFNGKLDWDVGRVQHFQNMFHNADLFNTFIGDWDVGGAIDDPDHGAYGFVSMFEGARDFNQDVSHWDMRHARTLDFMFRDAYSFDQDLSPWQIQEVESMENMFFRAKSLTHTLCWDLSGKAIGKIFDETPGASAQSNADLCWQGKSHDSHTSSTTTETSFTPEEEGAYKPPSWGWKFLQALLMAAVMALAFYWVLLARRYLGTRADRHELVQKVEERVVESTNESSSRSSYDDSANDEEANDDNISGQDEDRYPSDEDSVEILFETEKDQEMLRKNCFQEQDILTPPPPLPFVTTGDAHAEHDVPAIPTLPRQQAEQQRHTNIAGLKLPSSEQTEQLLQLSEAKGPVPDAQPQLRTQKLTANTKTEEAANTLFKYPVAMTNSPSPGSFRPLVGTNGHAISPATVAATPTKRIRVSIRKLLPSKGGGKRDKTKAAIMNEEAPRYVISGGNAVYQDAPYPQELESSSPPEGSDLV